MSSVSNHGFRWHVAVIHHQAIKIRRKYRRWGHEIDIMNSPTKDGDEWCEFISDPQASQAFKNQDIRILCDQALPKNERIIIHDWLLRGYTEAQIAEKDQVRMCV